MTATAHSGLVRHDRRIGATGLSKALWAAAFAAVWLLLLFSVAFIDASSIRANADMSPQPTPRPGPTLQAEIRPADAPLAR